MIDGEQSNYKTIYSKISENKIKLKLCVNIKI